MIPNPDRHITGNYGEDLYDLSDLVECESLFPVCQYPDCECGEEDG